MKLLELDSASDLDFHFHLDLASDCEVGVGPAQQFVDVRTDKLTGSRATRWQVPVTLAWQEAATATSALTRCPTWRCAALQQLLLAAQLDLAQLGMIKPPKVWIISFCNVLLPRSLRCLCSCLCPSHSPFSCLFPLLLPPSGFCCAACICCQLLLLLFCG